MQGFARGIQQLNSLRAGRAQAECGLDAPQHEVRGRAEFALDAIPFVVRVLGRTLESIQILERVRSALRGLVEQTLLDLHVRDDSQQRAVLGQDSQGPLAIFQASL